MISGICNEYEEDGKKEGENEDMEERKVKENK